MRRGIPAMARTGGNTASNHSALLNQGSKLWNLRNLARDFNTTVAFQLVCGLDLNLDQEEALTEYFVKKEMGMCRHLFG